MVERSMKVKLNEIWKRVTSGLIGVLLQHLTGGTEEYYENPGWLPKRSLEICCYAYVIQNDVSEVPIVEYRASVIYILVFADI